MPYKQYYTFKEYWQELTQSSPYKQWAKSNPNEAAHFEELAPKKINEERYSFPIDIARTHFGKTIAMMFVNLHGGTDVLPDNDDPL